MAFSTAVAKTGVHVVFATLCVIFYLQSCTPNQNKINAEKGVIVFHQKLDSAMYHDIYIESDAEFQNATSESDATAYLEAVHRKLGPTKRAELADWREDFSARRTLVHLSYDTSFEQGHAREDFTWSIHGDQATLLHYNIDSPTLVTK